MSETQEKNIQPWPAASSTIPVKQKQPTQPAKLTEPSGDHSYMLL